MTRTLLSCLCLVFLFFIPIVSQAQSEISINLTSIQNVGGTIEVTFETNKQFIVGDNRYVLHTGGQHFMHSKHPGGDEKKITFLLTPEEFDALPDGAEMVVVYGYYYSNVQLDGEGASSDYEGLHWNSGNLDKSLLNR